MSIVSPWIFYLIDLADNVDTICLILVLLSAASLIFFAGYYAEGCISPNCKVWESFIKWLKRDIAVLIISLLAVVFIPSKETMYKMLVANYVTYENVETATDAIKDSVDYIFDKLNGEEE